MNANFIDISALAHCVAYVVNAGENSSSASASEAQSSSAADAA